MSRLKARLDRLQRRHPQLDAAQDERERSPCYRAQMDAVIDIIDGKVPLGVYPPNMPVEYRGILLRSVKKVTKEAAQQKCDHEDYQRLNAWLESMLSGEKA